MVEGTGGTADAVAWATARENRRHFVPNPKLMEIAREGYVETVRLGDVDGKILQAMLERLFNGMENATAWRSTGAKGSGVADRSKREGSSGDNDVRDGGGGGGGVGDVLAASRAASSKRARGGDAERGGSGSASERANKKAKTVVFACCMPMGSRGAEQPARRTTRGDGGGVRGGGRRGRWAARIGGVCGGGGGIEGGKHDRNAMVTSPHATPTAVRVAPGDRHSSEPKRLASPIEPTIGSRLCFYPTTFTVHAQLRISLQ